MPLPAGVASPKSQIYEVIDPAEMVAFAPEKLKELPVKH